MLAAAAAAPVPVTTALKVWTRLLVKPAAEQELHHRQQRQRQRTRGSNHCTRRRTGGRLRFTHLQGRSPAKNVKMECMFGSDGSVVLV